MNDKIFPDGLLVKPPRQNAPEFIKGGFSIKRLDLIAWLQSRTEEWLNFDIKESGKTGNWYSELNTWKKESAGSNPVATDNTWEDTRELFAKDPKPSDEIKIDDIIPF